MNKKSLDKLREEKGYTQQSIANKVGISLTGYQYLEYGNRSLRRAQAQTVLNLANALGVTVEKLLELDAYEQ